MKRSKFVVAGLMGLAMTFAMPAAPVLAQRDVPKIVREARKVEESKREAEYTIPEDGQVWLVDMTAGERPIHSIELKKGMRYGFNTRDNAVQVNGKSGEAIDFNRDHTYAIFYVTEEARDAVNGGRRVRRDDDRGNTASSADRADREDRRSRQTADRARVPDTAEVVAEGRNEELSYEAKADGMAYLYNATDNKVIESWRLERGERITVSPRSNAIAIDQKTASRDIDLDKRSNYRLLFDRKKSE
ncbi:MAG TPA: hypothetical protein VF624_02350 [Tepidisphaeraceae bacterium]|jgi:hypothetical protein